MDEKLIICDTDVLIDYFDTSKPRHQRTKHILEEQILLDNIVISAITKMELFLGVANKVELKQTDKLIGRFGLLLINERITKQALELLKSYHLSHNLAIPDSIIASTAVVTDFELFTYNTKDFRFIKEIRLFKFS
jgi:predicted nucleic acid-binding protein